MANRTRIDNQLPTSPVTKQLLVNMSINSNITGRMSHQAVKLLLFASMNQLSPPVLIRQMMANSHRQIPKLTMNLKRLIVEHFNFF
ncbi:Uncharacterised protein [Streptococcus pneumoniae]|nr:Uncharacterised protein [Streptococcus pneumoniae]